jgi:hypothetical protein
MICCWSLGKGIDSLIPQGNLGRTTGISSDLKYVSNAFQLDEPGIESLYILTFKSLDEIDEGASVSVSGASIIQGQETFASRKA